MGKFSHTIILYIIICIRIIRTELNSILFLQIETLNMYLCLFQIPKNQSFDHSMCELFVLFRIQLKVGKEMLLQGPVLSVVTTPLCTPDAFWRSKSLFSRTMAVALAPH